MPYRRLRTVLSARIQGLYPLLSLTPISTRRSANPAMDRCPVLNRFLDFFPDKTNAQDISTDDLDQFMVFLKKKHRLGNNSIIHNMIIVASF